MVILNAIKESSSESGSSLASSVEESEVETSSASGSSSASSTEESETDKLMFESEELGISMELPPLLKGHEKIETIENEVGNEIVTRVQFLYEGESATVVLFAIEEMSTQVWEKMKSEGGPLGQELGQSEDGRVVVLYSPQSNPFKENTKDFEIMNLLPEQMAVITKTFQFIEK